MVEESNTGLLISNIVDQNHYSHCRLCLQRVQEDQFARFHDTVTYSTADGGVPLSHVIIKIFGLEVCHEVPGVDAICSDCLEKTLDIYTFIQQYETNTMILHKLIDNLNFTLSDEVNTKQNQVLYIVCNEDKSQLICIENEDNKKSILRIAHKCKSCKESFEDTEDLIAHNQTEHNLFTCEKCMHVSNNESDMREHETSSIFFKCGDCHQFRCTESSLKEHEDRTHGVHMCKDCGKAYRGLDKLLAHEGKHTAKNQCPKCGKNYTTKEFFERHVKLCLEDRVEPHPMRSRIQKTFFCQACGKGYSTAGGLRVHLRFVHGNADPHVCKECGKKFTAPCYLKAHMVTHSKEKNFPCDLCQGKFVTKEALLYHRRRHTGEKPYTCDECGERFVNASARVDHIKFKHVGPTLACQFCSRKFVTKNILKIHMKKHYNPSNKLYVGRTDVPHNLNGEQDLKAKIEEQIV